MKRASRGFWTTLNGRKLAHSTVAFSTFAVATGTFFPQTLLIKTYRDYMHLFRGNDKVLLPDELEEKFNKCLDILNLKEVSRRLQKPFTVFGFDVFHAGNAYTRQGAIIGIPINYRYKSESDIEKEDIQISTKPVKWVSPAGEQLAKCLIVPDDQQTFAICREILSTQNYQVHMNSLFSSMAMVMAFAFSRSVNEKFHLFDRPSAIRYTFYTLITLFTVGTYFFAKDVTQMSIEESVDEKLCELGPKFIQSGIEFYDNLIKRNIALRELLGGEGESSYSTTGNNLYYFRQKTLPLTGRKKYFESKLEEYKKNELELKKQPST
ncbi:transmembrane protein 177 [Arctopsyche grandis]|uniref:transmembrane protein 177 n=1 Tax=Arctopsyche grandis TaxID=121162 RepID=UPI00406DA052